jgi:hypothetical protein
MGNQARNEAYLSLAREGHRSWVVVGQTSGFGTFAAVNLPDGPNEGHDVFKLRLIPDWAPRLLSRKITPGII